MKTQQYMAKALTDRKTRKRIQIFKDRFQNRRHRLIGARQQPDEPDELEQVQREIVAIKEELRQLRGE